MSLSHQLPVPCSSPKTGPSSENAHREPAGGCALRTKGGPTQGAVKSQAVGLVFNKNLQVFLLFLSFLNFFKL